MKLPREYWDIYGAARRRLVANVNEAGTFICFIDEMHISEVLKIRISFTMGYGFDSFDALAKIIWQAFHTKARRKSSFELHHYCLLMLLNESSNRPVGQSSVDLPVGTYRQLSL